MFARSFLNCFSSLDNSLERLRAAATSRAVTFIIKVCAFSSASNWSLLKVDRYLRVSLVGIIIASRFSSQTGLRADAHAQSQPCPAPSIAEWNPQSSLPLLAHAQPGQPLLVAPDQASH